MPANRDWIESRLDAHRLSGSYRTLRVLDRQGPLTLLNGESVLNFSSNDYLGLSVHPQVIKAAQEALKIYGAGAGASRLVTGNLRLHEQLEQALSRFKQSPSCLLFGSGVLANIGLITTLAGKDDLIAVDRLIHASIIDGAVQSRATLARFRHNDPDDLRQQISKRRRKRRFRRTLVITESVFSMGGDLAPLNELAKTAAEAESTFIVDEAHAIGVFGENGEGLSTALGCETEVDVSVGTLSKALGCYGGFVCLDEKRRCLLINEARSLIFSTALPPSICASALAAVQVLREQPGMGRRLRASADRFRAVLADAGLNTLNSQSQIVPVVVGENQTAVRMSELLLKEGILAAAIREPTVPRGTARIRFSLSAAHSKDELDAAAAKIIKAASELRLI